MPTTTRKASPKAVSKPARARKAAPAPKTKAAPKAPATEAPTAAPAAPEAGPVTRSPFWDAVRVASQATDSREAAQAAPPADVAAAAEPTSILLPIHRLRAAALVAATKDVRSYLNGVFLHRVGSELRIVSTDGCRLLAQTIEGVGTIPEWITEDGIILPIAALREACRAKKADSLELTFGTGQARVELRPYGAEMEIDVTYRAKPIEGSFPDYARVVTDAGQSLAGGEVSPLDTKQIAPAYLRGAGEVAACLEARGVAPYIGTGNTAAVFTFAGISGALLIVMPMRGDYAETVDTGTQRLLGAGLKGTITALKAHLTRLENALTDDDAEGQAKAEAYRARIAELLANSGPALPAPAANPAAEAATVH
jgi:hypothetical protein